MSRFGMMCTVLFLVACSSTTKSENSQTRLVDQALCDWIWTCASETTGNLDEASLGTCRENAYTDVCSSEEAQACADLVRARECGTAGLPEECALCR